MPADPLCRRIRAELSARHDGGGVLPDEALSHLEECPDCPGFAARLHELDAWLGRERDDLAPDLSSEVLHRVTRRPRWWSVAAAAMVGIITGAVLGGVGTSLETVRAGDLVDLFHSAGSGVDRLAAEVLVVERGWHREVPERVYVGSLSYRAPEEIEISLVDTTRYPGPGWEPNDLLVRLADGELLTLAAPPCPVAALPGCSRPPQPTRLSDLRPFDDGVVAPLEVVGPGRILNRWGGVEVVAAPLLEGRPTIQIETTVAASGLVQALTESGAWRELHPSDRVVTWLDQETLVPLRAEVFAVASPERELWELRHGYRDTAEEPIFVVDLTLGADPDATVPVPSADARSAGFVDGPVAMPIPQLDEAMTPYRTGSWHLPNGSPVQVSSWSDARTWLRVESTQGWDEPRLFGLGGSFAEPIELRSGSLGYLSPEGSSISLHGEAVDVVIAGTLPVDELVAAAASLPVDGIAVPFDWEQAAVMEAGDLPPHVLLPEVDGWSVLGVAEGDRTTLLISGAGRRAVLSTQTRGDRLEPPDGPDFVAVALSGTTARFDISAQTLEWVEGGWVLSMRSETVGLEDLVDLAESMR